MNDSLRKDPQKPCNCSHVHIPTHIHTYMYSHIFSSFCHLTPTTEELKRIAISHIGFFPPHLPMQAVWCWVKPGGHLQAKLPMVFTHRNWQLCCLVAHSSRSTRKCKTGIGVELTARIPRSCLRRNLWVFISLTQVSLARTEPSKWLGAPRREEFERWKWSQFRWKM